jgi:predicted ATPase
MAGEIGLATSSFLGRQVEIARLGELVAGAQIVTLVGPAGIGKTRLATRFAELHAPAASAWFCDLTEAKDVGAVCAVVARALGVSLASVKSSAEAVDRVGVALATRGALLLVLDNCEHLREPGLLALQVSVIRSRRSARERRELRDIRRDAAARQLMTARGRSHTSEPCMRQNRLRH